MSKMSPVSRNRLLLGASATALILGAAPALADGNLGAFARVANPAVAAAQAVQAQATQGSNTSAVSQRALAAFAQASQIRAQMDAAQMAARAVVQAAQASVPNGIGAGGLQPAAGATPGTPLWLNANAPTQATTSDGRTEVAVQQTAPQAILNWQTFNVGQKTDVNFVQKDSTGADQASWVVLNRVNNPSANPTQILGTIKAPGTVMIMDRNGVIFGNNSQVNVGSIVAAAANISDGQFLNNGLYSTQSGGQYVPSITDALGQVKVEAGAQITTSTPASVLNGGGHVILLGGSVENDGSISTPHGQTLLAAGDAFLLRPGYGTSQNQFSTTLGTEVAPMIAVGSANGTVSNYGEISSQQGDITLAGRNVTQGGVALSTTDVNQRGTIHLLNSMSDSAGSVTLTQNSFTAVLPELNSSQTALDVQRDAMIADSATQDIARVVNANTQFDNVSLLSDRKDESRIEIVTGGNVDFQNLSFTFAQGGQVAVSAAKRIFNEAGAWIDVSGARDVALNVQNNDIMINVQGNDLRDDPTNRDDPNQPLYNQDIWVDTRDLIYVPAGTGGDSSARYYTPGGLLEVSGYLGNQGHGIGEWDAVGGTITLQASEIVAQPSSMFNVAGGSLDYVGGIIMQTLLQGADGKIYTANNAPGDIDMVSLGKTFQVLHPRWGDQYTESYDSSFTQSQVAQYEPGYIVGRDGGQLVLSAPTVLFDGDIDAETVDGADQTSSRPTDTDPYKFAQNVVSLPGSLSIGNVAVSAVIGGASASTQANQPFDTQIEFDANVVRMDPPTVLSQIDQSRLGTAILDNAAINSFGLGGLSAYTSSSIYFNAPVNFADGAKVSLVAPYVEINAPVSLKSGSISATDIKATANADLPYVLTAAGALGITLNAPLDLSGEWVNGLLHPVDLSKVGFVDGGSADFEFSRGIVITNNGSINASSGAAIMPDGNIVGGTGGDITLVAGKATIARDESTDVPPLVIAGSLQSYGYAKGGTLTINSAAPVLVSDTLANSAESLKAGTGTEGEVMLLAAYQLSAGEQSPVAVRLSSSAVLHSGTVLSTPLVYTTTTAFAGDTIPIGTSINVNPSHPTTTNASWTVPTGVSEATSNAGVTYLPGDTVPAGTVLTSIQGAVAADYVVPSSVFTSGLQVNAFQIALPTGPLSRDVTLATGSVWPAGVPLPVNASLPVGSILPGGTVLSRDAQVQQMELSVPAGSVLPGTLVLSKPLTISAGSTAPVSTLLSQDLVIPAGMPLPVASSYEKAIHVGVGSALPSAGIFPGNNYQNNPSGGCAGCVTTAADWTVPANFNSTILALTPIALANRDSATPYAPGSIVPAGSVIVGGGRLPAGYALPSSVFPAGLDIGITMANVAAGGVAAVAITIPAGSLLPAGYVLPADVTLQPGTAIGAGDTLGQAASFQQPLILNTQLFSSGFSSYNVNGQRGLSVADGTALDVTMPVWEVTPGSLTVPSGPSAHSALQLWTPPLFLQNPFTAQLTQRAGASLTLTADTRTQAAGTQLIEQGFANSQTLAPVYVGYGSEITVDPGQTVSIAGMGQVTVNGDITARGGVVNVLNNRAIDMAPDADPAGLSVWIGDNSKIDVSGIAMTAVDRYGRTYGTVTAGGSILVGGNDTVADADGNNQFASTDAYVIVRPGAVLDASGAEATLDLSAGSASTAPSRSTVVATDGGSVSINSYSGLYLDGTMRAFAGGASASGGTLDVVLEAPEYQGTQAVGGDIPRILPNNVYAGRVLTVSQDEVGSGLSSELAPGEADPGLAVGNAKISAQQVSDGGFSNLGIWSRDIIQFDGDVDLELPQSISLYQGVLTPTADQPRAKITLSAPYILLSGRTTRSFLSSFDAQIGGFGVNAPVSPIAPAQGSLTVDADLIDIRNLVQLGSGQFNVLGDFGSGVLAAGIDATPGFATTELVNTGDVRFLPNHTSVVQTTILPYQNLSAVITGGDLTVSAAQLYPTTGAEGGLLAGYLFDGLLSGGGFIAPGSVLTITSPGGEAPPMPSSAFGGLFLIAGDVEQGGVVRAPLGRIQIGTDQDSLTTDWASSNDFIHATEAGTSIINLLPGSVTSVSGAGLTMPYGGTPDGLNYTYDGQAISGSGDSGTTRSYYTFFTPTQPNGVTNNYFASGVKLSGNSITANAGSLIDLSGGGDLLGAGFVTGRGGSVDVLRTALVNANPTNSSMKSSGVYAIVPTFQGKYAPQAPDAGAGQPGVGQQITIPDGVPGLPAGTYTLLPSTYALSPGAFRVELGQQTTAAPKVGVGVAGSYSAIGHIGFSETNTVDSLATSMVITPASAVRTYSQYNETGLGDFLAQNAALFGTRVPLLPADSKSLELAYGLSHPNVDALTFQGMVNFLPADGGRAGSLSVLSQDSLEITGDEASPTTGFVSIRGSEIDAIGAPTLIIGGDLTYAISSVAGTYTGGVLINSPNSGTGIVEIQDGALLTAPQTFVVGTDVNIENGATLTGIGKGSAVVVQPTNLTYTSQGALVAVSNGLLTLGNSQFGGGQINVADGAQLKAEGTVGFSSDQSSIGDVDFAAKDLQIVSSTINVGNRAQIGAEVATGDLPSGWTLDPAQLTALVDGSNSGVSLQSLTLVASGSVNFIGPVSLNTINPETGASDVSINLRTPAMYGVGAAGDVATVTTGNLTWNVDVGHTPPYGTTFEPVFAGLLGAGSGTLNIVANNVLFGNVATDQVQPGASQDRLILGFNRVNITGTESISSNNKGTLSVFQSGPDPSAGFDPTIYAGSGGALALSTPLLTGAAGSSIGYRTGGQISINTSGTPSDTSKVSALGAEIDLTGGSIAIGTAIALPSGRLLVNSTGDIEIGAGAQLDLSGRPVTLFDVTKYSAGGDIEMVSTDGNIVQATGSVLNVSAVGADAGTISLSAVGPSAGEVSLGGSISGSAVDGFSAGKIAILAQKLNSDTSTLDDDFATLNKMLNRGGVFGERAFDLKQGDLVIGDEVNAHDVEISVDNGSLTVNGTINASNTVPGIIRLAALGDLTLNGTLDAHGTVLQTDSYGAPIFSSNSGYIELTAGQGTLTLAPYSIVDLRVTDPRNVDAAGNQIVDYGNLVLNAPRTSETSGDIKISAGGPLAILGAGDIDLYAVQKYVAASADGTVVQDNGSLFSVVPTIKVTATTTTAETLTTVTTITNVLDLEYPTSGDLVFNSVPTANTAIGEYTLYSYFFFPNSRGAHHSDATVVSGELADYFEGNYFKPGDQIGFFTAYAGWNTTIFAGTKISVTGVTGGTTLISFGGAPVVQNTAVSNTVLSSSTTSSPVGTPVGTTTATVNNPDGSQTITSIVTTANDTVLSQTNGAAAAGAALGSTTTTSVSPDGLTATITNVNTTENSDAGIVGLNQIDASNRTFMMAAGNNSILQNNIAGLTAYGSAFHLRPGVEIDSTSGGKLSTASNLDFSGFRYSDPAGYGLQVNPSALGSGEPGSIVFRAAGNLNVTGDVSDGFQSAPILPIGQLGVVGGTNNIASNVAVTSDITFNTLPTPITQYGEYGGGYLYFSYGLHPTVVQGSVVQPSGTVFGPGQTVNRIFVGTTVTAGTVLSFPNVADGSTFLTVGGVLENAPTPVAPLSAMLAAGSLSWSMRFVAGADLGAADTRLLQPLARLSLQFPSVGDLVLDNPGASLNSIPSFNVVRTGTGTLDLLAGGNIVEGSAFGVYTAGTATPALLDASGSDLYQQSRSVTTDGSVLGASNSAFEPFVSGYQAYYPDHGGNVLVQAQGDFTSATSGSSDVGQWLFKQGGSGIGQPAAWWINFGTLVSGNDPSHPDLAGFNGIGALGGGNVSLSIGRDADAGIDLAVASTGRVTADGNLVQTGGGDLTVNVGGALNATSTGHFTNLRGNTNISAASIGSINRSYGKGAPDDPRPTNPITFATTTGLGGAIITPGDGTVSLNTRGELVLSGVNDPGMANSASFTSAAQDGVTGNAVSWFSLWRPSTSVSLFADGGDVMPFHGADAGGLDNDATLFPASLSVTAAGGDILSGFVENGFIPGPRVVELAPSPVGQLELLASGSFLGEDATTTSTLRAEPYIIAMSGADLSSLATPLDPAYYLLSSGSQVSVSNIANTNLSIRRDSKHTGADILFAFGPDTITGDIHSGDDNPIRIYAGGDIVDLSLGVIRERKNFDTGAQQGTEYVAAKQTQVRAGNDIVKYGYPFNQPILQSQTLPLYFENGVPGLIANNGIDDVSVLSANRDILFANTLISGPGTLEVSAGRNIYQGTQGGIESIGPLNVGAASGLNSGASVELLAGVGSTGPNYGSFAGLYFNDANASGSVDETGKVVATYGDELLSWLNQNFSASQGHTQNGSVIVFDGNPADALSFFLALPPEQQARFVLPIYFDELKLSGREFNDPTSRRFQSYARGRAAISALFPDGEGTGNITMISGMAPSLSNAVNPPLSLFDSGVHTDFGGSISLLAPNGAVTLGAEGINPGAGTGLLTEGEGDIDVYSKDSIGLGLSRVFTTFGGNIVMWSADGDIAAGRGAKTAVVAAPVRVTTDSFGSISLAPTVPTTGAGIATLQPIEGVPPGDVDLIAPLGTVDAGEAGIRVSGNVNIAALHVVNAANIQVKGTATGLPEAVSVNTGALTAASNAATAVSNIADRMVPAPQPMAVPMVLTVQFLGFGE